MEIVRGIHIIPGTVGTKPLQLVLLRGDIHTALLDTGTAADPQQTIAPYLDSIGLNLSAIEIVIDTHADADHVGGNAAIKRANPRVLLSCGEADRELIENPQLMISRRYCAYQARHALGPDHKVLQWFADSLGEAQPIDWTWRGGETLRLGHDWVVEIHHTPGHSSGHLTIYDPRSCTALMGDAVHGGIGHDSAGSLTFPAYTHVEAYLQTVNHLHRMDIETLVGCHWQIKRGAEVSNFLNESETYVIELEQGICDELAQRAEGMTLRALIDTIGPKLSEGRPIRDVELGYTFAAHMDHLVGIGKVIEDDSVFPVSYKMCC